ncbi:MAG: APC family permease [Caldisericaceae bacterium]
MDEESVIFTRKASGLVRELNWWDVLLFTIAGPAASGMTYYTVKVPGLYPGGNMTLAFLVGLLVWLPPVVILAILSASFPRSGSLYVVISRVLHPLLGFIPNWSYVMGGGAALAVGFLNYLGLIPLASSIQIAGIVSKNASLITLGEGLADPMTRLWIALAITILMWIVELLGIDKLKWVLRLIIYIPLVITGIAIVIFFIKSGDSSFNVIFGANAYQSVHELATKLNIKDSFLSPGQAMQGMLLSVLWAYTAVEAVSYVGSEVKTPRLSYMRGMILGLLAVGLLYILNAVAVYRSFGYDFITEYSWLYYNHFDELKAALGTTPPAPSIPFYAAIIGKNTAFSIILGIGYFLWYINTSMIIWMAAVRGIFAMAFDRMLPLKLTEIGPLGSPTWANHLVGIVAIIGVFIGLGDSLGVGLSSAMLALEDFTCLLFIWPLGLAAMFLPFARPDLYEKSIFQYKLGKIPVISILGAITFAIGWWMMLNVTTEQNILAMVLTTLLILVGLLFVLFMWWKNREEGVDPNKIFKEIPPA